MRCDGHAAAPYGRAVGVAYDRADRELPTIEIADDRDRRAGRRVRPADPAAVVVVAAARARRAGGDRRPTRLGAVRRPRRRAHRRQPDARHVPDPDRAEGVDRGRRRRRRGPWPRGRRGAQPGRARRGPPPRRQGRQPDQPPVAGGGQPPVPAHRLRAPRRPTSTATRSTDRRRGSPRRARSSVEVLGGLADLPVAVGAGAARARRRPRRPGGGRGRRTGPARARPAGGSPACRSCAARMASSPRSSPIAPSAATAASRTSGSSPAPAPPASATSASSTSSPTTSCSPHAHAATSTTAGSASASSGREVDARVAGGDLGRPPAHGRVGVGERRRAARRRRARRGARARRARSPAPPGRRSVEAGAGAVADVAGVPGRRRRHGVRPVDRSLLEQVGERGHDPRQAERGDGGDARRRSRAPARSWRRPPTPGAAAPAGWYGGATASATS